jgi:hypothetical protein
MATAIGGRMRWEIIQNAMSSLLSVRRKRRPIVWARSANTLRLAANASSIGTPSGTRAAPTTTVSANSPTMPTRGRYRNRVSAYAAKAPMTRVSTALVTPTKIVLPYGRSVSFACRTTISSHAASVGWKSTNGMKNGPRSTWMGVLNDVIASQ